MTSRAAFQHATIAGTHCLLPLDDEGLELLKSMKVGREVIAEIHSPRNPRHHRLLFVLRRRIIDGGAWEGDAEGLLDWIKYATGHVRTSVDHNGNVHYTPKSIAFASMGQDKFNRFFDRAVYAICHRLLAEKAA